MSEVIRIGLDLTQAGFSGAWGRRVGRGGAVARGPGTSASLSQAVEGVDGPLTGQNEK